MAWLLAKQNPEHFLIEKFITSTRNQHHIVKFPMIASSGYEIKYDRKFSPSIYLQRHSKGNYATRTKPSNLIKRWL